MGNATITIGTEMVDMVAFLNRLEKSSISYRILDLLLNVMEAACPIAVVAKVM